MSLMPDGGHNDLRWQTAETLAYVTRLNTSFLLAETRSTVYHSRPVAAETRPLAESPWRLHDCGFLTYLTQHSRSRNQSPDP